MSTPSGVRRLDDWGLVQCLLPQGWERQARLCGALRRARGIRDAPTLLRVLLVHLAFGRPVLESFLFAVALAVGLTPELLPMIMTVTLSRGAIRMAEKSVVVKRLAAIQERQHDFLAGEVVADNDGVVPHGRDFEGEVLQHQHRRSRGNLAQ